ncbi:MAG: molybdopterin-dependent oxidoreductase, partial [Mariprofundales bacterium]|nr:molybdopterin-dependent oxidoreductase [Mariprofundales bacterium]
ARAMEQMSSVGKTAAGMSDWLEQVESRHEAGKALADALITDSCALLVGEEIRGHEDAAALIYGLDLLMRACGHAEKETDGRNLIPQGMNSQPLEYLFADRRESVATLLAEANAGNLDTLLLIGSDPLGDGLFPVEFQQAAERCAVVQVAAIDCSSSRYAAVQLPTLCYAEVDGTFVNMAGRLRRSSLPLSSPDGEGRPLWRVMMRLLQAMGEDVPVITLDELRDRCEQLMPGSKQAWDGTAVDQWLMPVARDRQAIHLPSQQRRLKKLDIVSRSSMYREGSWARASNLLIDAGRLHAMADLILHSKTVAEAGFAPGDEVTIRTYSGEYTHHIGVRDDVCEGVLFIARRGVAGELSSDNDADLVAVGGGS